MTGIRDGAADRPGLREFARRPDEPRPVRELAEATEAQALAFVAVVGAGDAGWRPSARLGEIDRTAGREWAAYGSGNLEFARSEELRPVRELAEATEARVLAFAAVVGTGDAGWRRGAHPRELDRMAGMRDCAAGGPDLRALARPDEIRPVRKLAEAAEARAHPAAAAGSDGAGERRGAGASA